MTGFIDREEVKIIPALISFALLLVFIAPLFKHIVNIGNIFGMAVSGALTLAFIFYGRTAGRLKALWESTAGKVAVCICGGLAALFVVYALTVSVFMVRSSAKRPANSDTTLIVLGCRAKNGYPSRMLRMRLDAAGKFLEENGGVNVVVSGGKGKDEATTEAWAMKQYLVSKGIAPERIFMEDKSVNTEQNLRYSMDIIRQEGLSQNVTIVTDGYHQLRAKMIAKKIGIDDNCAISADTSKILLPTYWVREWFAIPYYLVRGKA
ncbi:MAG: YdcF family protein [Ruminococcus sp.]|nr:YdcF family protein [Ruminococcus sp.]